MAIALAVLASSLIIQFACCQTGTWHEGTTQATITAADTGSSAKGCGPVHNIGDHHIGSDLFGGPSHGSGGAWLLLLLTALGLAASSTPQTRADGPRTSPAHRRQPPAERALHIDLCVARS